MQNKSEPVEEVPNESQGPIKTPRQLMITVVLAFVIPISIIILLVNLASFSSSMGAGSSAQTPEAIAERIQPVAGFKLVDADAEEETMTGEEVFEATCASCHSAGVAGAPKLGDEGDWASLIDSGLDEMVRIAIEGKGAMPPRGGNANLSDLEVTRAVVYMANESGGSFDEPDEEAADDKATEADDTQDAADEDDQATSDDSDDQQAEDDADADENGDDAAAADSDDSDESAGDTDADDADSEDKAASDDDEGEDAADSDEAELDPAGEKLYDAVCLTCHAQGVAGAPKTGSKEDWEPYIETGMDAMLKNAIEGVGAMPPRGGSDASDEEVEAAIEYMIHDLD